MAKGRRRASGRRMSLVVWGVVLVAAGLALGALMPGCRPAPRVAPSGPPAAPAPESPPAGAPVPAPVPTSPAVVSVDQTAVDAAVNRALRRVGTPRLVSEARLTQRSGDHDVQWLYRRVDITPRLATGAALDILRKEVEGAGGKVLSRSASTVRVGVVQGELSLVTHEIRLLVAQPPRARVAIIFDDAGGSLVDLDAIIALRRPVTVAVLPGLRYSREVALRARAAGLEVLLHLPMEPEDASLDLGPGGIRAAMSDEEIAAVVREDLLDVPGAIGVNNHMGSKGTADERVMRVVLGVVRDRRLIFVDSKTSSHSIASRVAAEMDIPTAARAVFLDNDDEPGAIRAQVERLIAVAKERGDAVAIGHAQRSTAKVLLEMLGEFERQGVELVLTSMLVH